MTKHKKQLHWIIPVLFLFLICVGGGIAGAGIYDELKHPKHHPPKGCFPIIDSGNHRTFCGKKFADPQPEPME
jgi:hypothetical protein